MAPSGRSSETNRLFPVPATPSTTTNRWRSWCAASYSFRSRNSSRSRPKKRSISVRVTSHTWHKQLLGRDSEYSGEEWGTMKCSQTAHNLHPPHTSRGKKSQLPAFYQRKRSFQVDFGLRANHCIRRRTNTWYSRAWLAREQGRLEEQFELQ